VADWDHTAVSVSYIGSLGRNLPIFIDQNLPNPTSTITYTVAGGALDGQAFTVPLFTGARPNTNFGRITISRTASRPSTMQWFFNSIAA